YDPNQHYYDPNNPHAWQSAQMPGGGPPPKPAYKQWWFWTIIGIIVVGIVVLIFALLSRDDEDPASTDPNPTQQSDPSPTEPAESDRKSTRLNSSHVSISYAVFCLKKKTLSFLVQTTRKHLAIDI